MKVIFLFALVAFASAAKKQESVNLVNPKNPDENKVTFGCPFKKKAYCGRRKENDKKFFQIKWAHEPKNAKEGGFNCERMNAANNFCCDSHWNPNPNMKAPDESTIFDNVPSKDVDNNCKVQAGNS